MVLKFTRTSPKRIDHLYFLTQRYSKVVRSCPSYLSLGFESCWCCVTRVRRCVRICDSARGVMTRTVDVDLHWARTHSISLPDYHINLWHWSAVAEWQVAILGYLGNILDWLRRSVISDVRDSTITESYRAGGRGNCCQIRLEISRDVMDLSLVNFNYLGKDAWKGV